MAEDQLKNISEEDLQLLNSRFGLRYLFGDKKTDVKKALRLVKYELELRNLQAELIKLQNWIIKHKKKLVIVFEGRDAAGKGGAIRRIAGHINPRHYKIIALPKPSEEEEGQWYFQRYVNKLPKLGEMVFFDRSWYNRAVVEPVNGFCTPKEYEQFIDQVNDFEKMILNSDCYLIKFYFSISKEEQARRFKDIKSSPLKKWKMTSVDERAQELWDDYTKYKEEMFKHTNTEQSPWVIVKADKKTEARISVIKYILEKIPFRELNPEV